MAQKSLVQWCRVWHIPFRFISETTHNLALSCTTFNHLALSCIILHHLASSCESCIILHRLASSCIALHHLASSCIVLHHLASLAQIQKQPKFARPRLWWRQQDFHKGAAELCHSEPFLVGSCPHTNQRSQVTNLIFWYLWQSTTEPFRTMWNSFYMKFFKFGSQCNFPIIHLQHATHRNHKKKKHILQDGTMRRTYNF